jgi:hypothetical protein
MGAHEMNLPSFVPESMQDSIFCATILVLVFSVAFVFNRVVIDGPASGCK